MFRFIGIYLFVVSATFVPPSIFLNRTEGCRQENGTNTTMSQFRTLQNQDDQQKGNLSASDQKKKSLIDAKLKAHAAVTKRLMRVVHRGKHSPLVVFQEAIELEKDATPDWVNLKTQANWVEILGIALAESPIPNGKTYLEMSKELKESISKKDASKLKSTVQFWNKSCVRCHSSWAGVPK
jgi:hypothetical protein